MSLARQVPMLKVPTNIGVHWDCTRWLCILFLFLAHAAISEELSDVLKQFL